MVCQWSARLTSAIVGRRATLQMVAQRHVLRDGSGGRAGLIASMAIAQTPKSM
jgi:hypothetical protein